jgi:Tfp pilus assembly protein PilP
MTRPTGFASRVIAAAVVTGIAGGAVSLYAQAPAATPAPAAPAAASPAAAADPLQEPQGYTYTADGRRDPFVSLLRRGSASQKSPDGARPRGLAGFGAAEVTLKGTLQGREGWVAILQGGDSKSYLVRSGDKLLDGTIRTITADAVVILQQVNDPLSLQKQREVRKTLRQSEEAK